MDSVVITPEILSLAQTVWNYLKIDDELEKADAILVLGSHDLRVADRGAELFLQGFAPWLIFTGGLGNFTRQMWTTAEADLFAERALEKGVPKEAILIENKSTNTGENIKFTQKLLAERGLICNKLILVQKPYMGRRSFATAKQHWPDKDLLTTAPLIEFKDYINEEFSYGKVINIMVGDLQRIKLYPAKGFQVYQEIPDHVWEAFEKLLALGFDKHLIKDV